MFSDLNKKYLVFIYLFLLSCSDTSEIPSSKNEKYIVCNISTGQKAYIEISEMLIGEKKKGKHFYITIMTRYEDDSFINTISFSNKAVYASDNYYVFENDWLYKRDYFIINRNNLNAALVDYSKFPSNIAKRESDSFYKYYKDNFPAWKFKCNLTKKIKKI